MADRNLGNGVDAVDANQENCPETHGRIGRKLTHLMTTIGASALLVACGSANAEDKAEKAELTSMPVAEQPIVKEASVELPEFMSYVEDGKFSFKLCRDAGYDTKGCLKFKREHVRFLTEQSRARTEENYAEANEAIKEMTESLNN